MERSEIDDLIRELELIEREPQLSIRQGLFGRISIMVLPGLLIVLAINIIQIIVPKFLTLPVSNPDANIEQTETEQQK